VKRTLILGLILVGLAYIGVTGLIARSIGVLPQTSFNLDLGVWYLGFGLTAVSALGILFKRLRTVSEK